MTALTTDTARADDERLGLSYVALAVLFFSSSAVLVRLAAPLSPYEIAAGRLLVAAAAVLGLSVLTERRGKEWARLTRRDLPLFALFGLVAALHFLLYIASLQFTSIAHSLAIIYTSPIFVTLLSAWFLREPIVRRKWGGILIAVVGVAILAGFEPRLTPRILLGDAMALGSAIAYGFYSVVGRSQRGRFPLFLYAGMVYLMAALWTLPIALAHLSSAYGSRQVFALLGLGIGPLALGHTLYNAALRKAHATSVNLIATQEVTGGILLGFLLLGETPSLNALIGAMITLLGIALVVKSG
jgi:drug/metabolite transporter (DMT)-like permease